MASAIRRLLFVQDLFACCRLLETTCFVRKMFAIRLNPVHISMVLYIQQRKNLFHINHLPVCWRGAPLGCRAQAGKTILGGEYSALDLKPACGGARLNMNTCETVKIGVLITKITKILQQKIDEYS